MTFLSAGGLAMFCSSVILVSLPIPNATTFVPVLPVVTLFSKLASAYNVKIIIIIIIIIIISIRAARVYQYPRVTRTRMGSNFGSGTGTVL